MRVIISWVGLLNDKVSLERLNQGGLLYPMNMSFHGMCCRLWKLKNVCMWLLKTFKVQRIISIALLKFLKCISIMGMKHKWKTGY